MKNRITLLLLFVVCLVTPNVAQTTYNYYFGNIHSQSSYSDGNKDSITSLISTPFQDFNYAKASQHIDFYGISDHNHHSAGMVSKSLYHKGIAQANMANQDGSFVALYGMEWGELSSGGHVIIYGCDSLIGWESGNNDIYVAKGDYNTLWKKINQRPGVFGYWAHPQATDYNNIFNTALDPAADNAVIGMASRSGPAFSTNTTYSDPSTSNYIARYRDALKLGYHVGIGLDHDSHNSVFGRQSAGRLVILAPSLTRANILDGLRKMRFYSSDDWNTKVNFTISSQPIGSIISHAGSPTLSVTVTDPDASDNIASIRVYYGVPGSGAAALTLTSNTNATTLTYTHSIANNSIYYYYLEITQADGDMIWTSPIWYTRQDTPANAPVAAFTPGSTTICEGQTINLTDNSTNNPTSWAWSIPGGTPASSNIKNPSVTFTTPGTYNITLTSSNAAGNSSPVSHSVTVNPKPATPVITNSGAILTSSSTTSNQWYMNNVLISGATGASYTATGGGSYSVIVTNQYGCSTTTASPVTLLEAAVNIALSSGNNPLCAGSTILLKAYPTNGGSNPAYQWKVGGINVGTNSNTYSTPSLTNGQTVTCTMTSNQPGVVSNTATSNTITFTVNPVVIPSVSIALTSGSNPSCEGTSRTYTATPTNGGTTPIYQWKVNGTNTGTFSSTFTTSALTNGQTVSCILSSNQTCTSPATATSNSITASVTSLVTPNVSIAITSGSNPSCVGASKTFTASPASGGTTPGYQWKIDGTNTGTNSSTFSTSSLTAGQTVTCVLTSNQTCISATNATSNGITASFNSPLTPAVTIVITSGTNPGTAGNAVTFTATPTNGGTSPAYQWQVDGINAGTNTGSFITSSLTNNQSVTCIMTSNETCVSTATATSNAIKMSITAPLSYCSATTSNTTYEYISNVNFGSISNASNNSAYTDYGSLSTSIPIGSSQTITVTNGSPYSTDRLLIWCDWNNNGVFTDAGERIYTSNSGTGPYSTSITPPAGAVVGKIRMRMRLTDYNSGYSSSPCGSSSYGEVEDYSINVMPPAKMLNCLDCATNENNTIESSKPIEFITVYPNPNNGNFTIKANEEGTHYLLDETGRVVQTIKLSVDNNYTTAIKELNPGFYMVVGQNKLGTVKQRIAVVK